MIKDLIKKAKSLIKYCEIEGTARGVAYYNFKFDNNPISVAIATDETTKLKNCTCGFHSKKDPLMASLCSFYIACILKEANYESKTN